MAKISFNTEVIDISKLKDHPDNYRVHTQDQLDHIVKSIQNNGLYRPIVVAEDNTILAGHGIASACRILKLKEVSVFRLNIKPNSIKAKKLLTGDNEISKRAEVDDRKLTDILKEISSDLDGLLGTGFDLPQLANLAFITRPETELKDFNAAAEWVGLPEYIEKDDKKDNLPIIEITFKNKRDRDIFVKKIDLKIKSKLGDRKWSTTWPFTERNDAKSVKFKIKKKK